MRIFIVDDDPDFRGLAARAMRREFGDGISIEEIGDQATLRERLDSAQPDILISDFSLRWSDGLTILAEVRAAKPDCVAVMFTGTGNEDLAVRAIKAGFDDYIVKRPQQLRRLGIAARTAYERQQARRLLEDNRDLLTAELYHRLHNNLQLVIGMLAFTAREITDADARQKLNDVARRVRALSLLQERLYRERNFQSLDFAAFLGQMVDNIVALDPRQISATVNAEAISLPVTLAVPLALIANELVTNAMKHAFKTDEGTITISFRLLDNGDYSLEVGDNGVGIGATQAQGEPAGGPGWGLGLGLVQRLAQQISGQVDVTGSKDGGSLWRVRMPSGTGAA